MFLFLIFSVFLMCFSVEWLIIWAGMELNLISFLSLKKNYSLLMNEFEFKYFYIQFFGSALFLVSFLFGTSVLLFLSLMIKLLMIPFIFWILSCLNWVDTNFFLVFLTIQKIGPLIILKNFYYHFTKMNVILFFLFNIFTSALFIVPKVSMKIIISFSSVFQTSFLLLLLNLNKPIFYNFFFFYLIMVMFLMKNFFSFSMVNAIFLFLALGGFPFFFIFFMKMELIVVLVAKKIFFFTILIFFCSGILFYVYLKLLIFKMMKFLNSMKMSSAMNWPAFAMFQILGVAALG